jgi:hypothetical protein
MKQIRIFACVINAKASQRGLGLALRANISILYGNWRSLWPQEFFNSYKGPVRLRSFLNAAHGPTMS